MKKKYIKKKYMKNVRGRESPNYYENDYDEDYDEDFLVTRFYDYCNPNRIDFEIVDMDCELTPIQREALNSLLV
jgi:hypothetical protein